jgi:hypothetical protein
MVGAAQCHQANGIAKHHKVFVEQSSIAPSCQALLKPGNINAITTPFSISEKFSVHNAKGHGVHMHSVSAKDNRLLLSLVRRFVCHLLSILSHVTLYRTRQDTAFLAT